MPLPFGFGHRPSWEHDAPEGSGTALEDPRPQPIGKGWRGKVVIVTGGATGLGRHIALEFGRLGCTNHQTAITFLFPALLILYA